MNPHRSPKAELEPAFAALAQGRYEAAFMLLEGAVRRQRDRRSQALIKLHVAAVFALYAQDGLEGGLLCLGEALERDSGVAQLSLYRALYWEFSAYRGDAPADVRRGAVAAARDAEPLARYHAASALLAVGAHRHANRVLQKVELKELPAYLHWRYCSLLGQTFEHQHAFHKAADAYRQAVQLSVGAEQQSERLNLAACWIEAGEAKLARTVLSEVDMSYLSDPAEKAVKSFLEGRAHLVLGNPHEALQLFLEAHALEQQAGEVSFNLQLTLAQTYATLGDLEHALPLHEYATKVARPEQLPFALHEYAFALFEADRLLEARDILMNVMQEENYPHRAEVYADLAEIEFRLGNLDLTAEHAQRALDLGATTAACLCLGNVAFEYYRLDEAAAWFEQALSASREGDADWLVARQMLVDIEVQRGYAFPERLIRHAEAAMPFVPPASDLAFTFRMYIDEAKRRFGGCVRELN